MKFVYLSMLTLVTYYPLACMEEQVITTEKQHVPCAPIHTSTKFKAAPSVRLKPGGPKIQLKNPPEEGQLFNAASSGDLKKVSELIESEVNPNAQKLNNGKTALMLATADGHRDIVQYLLSHGANSNLLNLGGLTALHIAVIHGNYEITKLLLNNGSMVNAQAAEEAEEEDRGRTPLLFVGRMTEGAKKKGGQQMTVQQAIKLTELLLEYGADPFFRDKFGKTAGEWAQITPSQGPLAAILRKKTKQFPKIEIPLWKAAEQGNFEAVNWYLVHGSSVNNMSPEGMTALALAAQNGHHNIVARFIEAGADPNKKSRGGDTALMFAIKSQQVNTAKQLIDGGAHISHAELSTAAKLGNEELIKILVISNVTNDDLKSAEQIADENGHVEIKKLLEQIRVSREKIHSSHSNQETVQ